MALSSGRGATTNCGAVHGWSPRNSAGRLQCRFRRLQPSAGALKISLDACRYPPANNMRENMRTTILNMLVLKISGHEPRLNLH